MAERVFRTADGTQVPAVTADEMREVDRIAVDELGPGLLQMMENAGRNLAGVAREMVGDGRVTVVAGSGGNGGGGLCAARHLANHGTDVQVVLDRDPATLQGAAATQFHTLDAMGVGHVEGDAVDAIADAALVVDALVGYGLSGPLTGLAADLVTACNAHAGRMLSLDVPSGVDATTGERPGPAVAPDRTLTLALPKTGLAAIPGDVYLADIGIPAVVFERAGVEYPAPFDEEYWLPLVD